MTSQPVIQVSPTGKPLPEYVNDPEAYQFMVVDLARSGLKHEDVNAYTVARIAGFPCYCIDYGGGTGMYEIRLRVPILPSGKPAYGKYHQPKEFKGIGGIFHPKNQSIEDVRRSRVFYFVEGAKKAAKFKLQFPHLIVFGYPGAWNLVLSNGRLINDILSCIPAMSKIHIIPDADIETKIGVQAAADDLVSAFAHLGCEVSFSRPPHGNGVDDWLVASPDAKLTDLVIPVFEEKIVTKTRFFKQVDLKVNSDGDPIHSEYNAKQIVEGYYGDDIEYDTRLGLLVKGQTISKDDLERDTTILIQKHLMPKFPANKIRGGLMLTNFRQSNFVLDIIHATKWDGVERLNTWGSEYFEVESPVVANEWGRILMTGFGLRLQVPGTKVDNAFILMGPQGIGKTTFWEELSIFGGHNTYYAVRTIAKGQSDDNRTSGHALSYCTVADLVEGLVFAKGSVLPEALKTWISETIDEFRVAFAKSNTKVPRSFIVGGTANRANFLNDYTGNRRFFTLDVKSIKRLPYQLKLQLLAEVFFKSDALRSSDWYAINIPIQALSIAQRAHLPHSTNAQEVLNASAMQHNELQLAILELFDRLDTRPPTFKEAQSWGGAGMIPSEWSFVTSALLAGFMGDLTTSGQTKAANELGKLSTAPAYPYIVKDNVKISMSKLSMNGTTASALQGVRQSTQLRGWAFKRKPIPDEVAWDEFDRIIGELRGKVEDSHGGGEA